MVSSQNTQRRFVNVTLKELTIACSMRYVLLLTTTRSMLKCRTLASLHERIRMVSCAGPNAGSWLRAKPSCRQLTLQTAHSTLPRGLGLAFLPCQTCHSIANAANRLQESMMTTSCPVRGYAPLRFDTKLLGSSFAKLCELNLALLMAKN